MKIRAGANIQQSTGYKAFIPELLPPQNPELQLNLELINLLSQADLRLGKLVGLSTIIKDPDLFVYLYVRKEALLSSQIEGTQCSLEDLFDSEDLAPGVESASLDIKEVSNYVWAMNNGLEKLSTTPISSRLLKELHYLLLTGTRGENKQPGSFRTSQNWIGRPGANLNTADFVPPPPNELDRLMSNLENFIHNHDDFPPLVKVALVHAQFETIHPFLDGNGRLGRLLITFLLVSWGVLDKPLLYLSYFFKANRTEYYSRLMNIRFKGEWEEWIKFFLNGVIESSEMASTAAIEIFKLHEEDRQKIQAKNVRNNLILMKIFDVLCKHPTVTVKDLQRLAEIETYIATSRSIVQLKELGILKEMSGEKRNKKFTYESYLNILKRDTVGGMN
ncbi:MAG: Fic family protein [Bacteriovoracaceae bacterium]|nr:Fic family protein [Bacteriovoracaceae bacterium]